MTLHYNTETFRIKGVDIVVRENYGVGYAVCLSRSSRVTSGSMFQLPIVAWFISIVFGIKQSSVFL